MKAWHYLKRSISRFLAFFHLRHENLPEFLLITGMVVYSTFFSIYLIQKFDNYRTGYFDFGFAVQSAWLVSKGSLNGLALGRPITILAGLIYAAYPYPGTLLVLQSYALAIGALPIYLLAKRDVQSRFLALALSQLYLISPVLWGINQYEFHDLAFSVPFLLFAVYFYRIRRVRPYVVSMILALMSNPFVVVIALAMGVSFLAEAHRAVMLRKNLRFPLITLVCCVAFVAYLQILPLLPLYQLANVGTQTYTFTGSSAYANPLVALGDPIGSVTYLWVQKSLYLLSLLGPVLFLPVLSPSRFLPALPWLGVVIAYTPKLGAGGVGPVYELSQWSSFLVPFVFLGAVDGLRRLQASRIASRFLILNARILLALMILFTLVVAAFASGLSPIGTSMQFAIGDNSVPNDFTPSMAYHGIWPTPVKDHFVLNWFVGQIPNNYSVLTQNQIGSKLGERFAPVYTFYQPGYRTVYTDAILVDNNLAGLCSPCLDTILASGNYSVHLSYADGGIYLYYRVGLS